MFSSGEPSSIIRTKLQTPSIADVNAERTARACEYFYLVRRVTSRDVAASPSSRRVDTDTANGQIRKRVSHDCV